MRLMVSATASGVPFQDLHEAALSVQQHAGHLLRRVVADGRLEDGVQHIVIEQGGSGADVDELF